MGQLLSRGARHKPAGGGGASGLVRGDAELMTTKGHGSCGSPPQGGLRWSVDAATADRICCYNRHYAEHAGYAFEGTWPARVLKAAAGEPTTYRDSVTGAPLFRAPVGRTAAAFLKESKAHGWPSFRDDEVNWDHVRVLPDGECVSTTGTHLGHNLPDAKGNRYCINLVSVAGRPLDE